MNKFTIPLKFVKIFLMLLNNLNPKALWRHFEALNAIPRPSKKEEKIRAFMMKFGRNLSLTTLEDPAGNVIIKKPASPGYENHPIVALQSHLDMVHQKNEETLFDFENQGIKMFIEDGFVRARGTTLGADNGIGVAAIMAVLEDKNLKHPPLEALFTIDEEAGMTGAKQLDASLLKAEILLNLDTEEDDEVDIGCAGGIDVTATGEFTPETETQDWHFLKITLKGLRGGHSGMDIHRGYGNANKLLAQILTEGAELFNLRIAEVQGGTLRNAIPREAYAVVATPEAAALEEWIKHSAEKLKNAYAKTEKNLQLAVTACPKQELAPVSFQQKWLSALNQAHNGVYSMDAQLPDLVETSNNVAKIYLKNGQAEIACLTRSSAEESKKELAQKLTQTFKNQAFHVTTGNEYPGWQPDAEAEVLKKYIALYQDFNGVPPNVVACHAGLECGLLKKKMPQTQMISFGPNISGAHSPDERVEIASVEKFWKILIALLEKL